MQAYNEGGPNKGPLKIPMVYARATNMYVERACYVGCERIVDILCMWH